MKQILLLLFATFFLAQITHAAIITVDDDGAGDHTTISAAIAAATSGDIINITGGGDGIHTEDAILIDKNLTIQGQGQSATTVQAASSSASATERVFLIQTMGLTVSFQDLMIKHGNALASVSNGPFGGGVYILSGPSSNITFERVSLIGNRADEDGGGVYIGGGDVPTPGSIVSFTDCVFENNEANVLGLDSGGGGITNFGAESFTLNRCTVVGNVAGYSGGGINAGFGDNTFINCTIYNNTAGGANTVVIFSLPGFPPLPSTLAVGGGLTLTDADSYKLINCTVVNNNLINPGLPGLLNVRAGGGILHFFSSGSFPVPPQQGIGTLEMINTIVANNTGASDLLGIPGGNDFFEYTPLGTIITQSTSLVEDCSDFSSALLGVSSCPAFSFTADPNLDVVALCGLQSYFTPLPGSPALDVGTAPGGNIPSVDICGAVRLAPHDIGGRDASASLPVKLIAFEAQTVNEKIRLNWETASELNNSHFEVEWSQNGREFEKIGEVQGAGTSSASASYSFLHPNPEINMNHYRLKQVDLDGRFVYTSSLSVNLDPSVNKQLQLYPNPANTLVSLKVPARARLRLLDLNGQLLIDKTVYEAATLDISAFPDGIYLLKVGTEARRLMIRR